MIKLNTICHRSIPQRFSCHSSSQHYKFSTTPKNDNSRNRVPKALYRQILYWCRRNEGVPFNALPPLTLAPPQVNLMALRRLKEMRSFLDRNSKDLEGDQIRFRQNNHPAHYALYNKDIVVKDNLITFPEIRDTNELRSVIRSVYWLNNEQTIANIENANDVGASSSSADDDQKGQISLAFEAIKSCNQLSSNELDSRRKKRESAIEVRNRKEGVVPLFHVGQVIQQKKAKWRGVIVGWTVDEAKASSGQLTKNRLTSLTTKQYEIREAKGDAASYEDSISSIEATVKYTILVDMNDSSLLHTSKSISLESQEDLVPVDEPCLRRISSNLINQYFSHFDPSEGGYFAPNKVLKYMYPLDRFSDNGNEGIEEVIDSSPRNAKAGLFLSPEQQDACKAISNGIHDIGHRLLSPLLKLNTQQQNDENGVASLASALLSNLQAILQENERGISTPSSPLDSAISSIKRLDQFYAKLIALQWSHDLHKKHNKNNNNNIHFKLGQTVKHKLFNFRGVVTAWDPKPYVDVSQWDGLQGVDNPNEKPFYHIRTDTNDCIREFGSPRPYRYVCQDNLEPYDLKHGRIELEMELDKEEWGWDKENGWFVPSEEIKFMHAEDVGNNEEAIVETIQKLKEIISDCFLSVQGRGTITGLFSLDDLFCLLKTAGRLEDAIVVQDMIKEVFKEFPDSLIRKKLDSGITELIEGKTKKALETFSDIVGTEPAYGEAWNKKATVHYMLGEREAAIEASNKALEADPRNFQALAGIGLVEMDALNDMRAITAFQKCLALNPWSVVSARLSICINRRDRSSSADDNVSKK